MNKKKHFHSLVALALAIMMVVPAALGVASNAAAKKTPGTVTLTKISAPAYNKVKVEWKKTSNATHYKIYYRKVGTSKWNGVKTVSGTASSYTHTSSSSKPIVVGQKYEYTVKGYNSTSKASGKYNTKGLTVQTLPATVKLNAAKLNSAKNAVTVSWNKAAGCNYYLVYRKTGSSGWKKIATVKNSVLSYTDVNPVKGEKNIYTVKGYYSKTKVSGKYDTKGVAVMVPKKTNVPIEDFELESGANSKTVNLKDGPFTFKVEFYPSNVTDKSITWTSSDPSVATVDQNGTVTPLKAGQTKIVAQTKGPQDFCYVTVYDIDSMIQQALELTNIERAKAGCPPVQTHPNLQKAAMIRAKELSVKFSHDRPDGSGSGSVYTETGVANGSSEIIAAGADTAKEAIYLWMNSPGHKSHLLGAGYKYSATGVYTDERGCTYWAQLFTTGNPDDRVTVTLNTMGGSQIEPIRVPTHGSLYSKDIPIPTRPGYIFDGWYNSADYYTRFTGIKYLDFNATFYAKWLLE